MTQRVLITGGAGFIGTHLSRVLDEAGWSVTVLDSLLEQVHGPDPERSPGVRTVRRHARLVRGSVTSRHTVAEALAGQDAVVHLAAETGTGQSMYEFGRHIDVNIAGTGTLLDVLAGERHEVRRLVVASSRSVYGEGRYRCPVHGVVHPGPRHEADMRAGRFEPFHDGCDAPLVLEPTDEGARLHPSSVYGITKLTQESLVMTIAPTLGIAPVALRYQNVYGPGQSLSNAYTGILSIFSTLIRSGSPINIFEDGRESRDFVFVEDVARATATAVTLDDPRPLVANIGSGIPTTVTEVAEGLQRALGREVECTVSGNFRVGDIRHNVADLAVGRARLGYAPCVGFAEGLARFTAWVDAQEHTASGYDDSLEEMRSRGLLK